MEECKQQIIFIWICAIILYVNLKFKLLKQYSSSKSYFLMISDGLVSVFHYIIKVCCWKTLTYFQNYCFHNMTSISYHSYQLIDFKKTLVFVFKSIVTTY